MKKKEITVGSNVEFDSDEGPQEGRVADIKPDLGNGQRIAMVCVPGTFNGKPWEVPLNDLRHAQAAARSSHFVERKDNHEESRPNPQAAA